MSYALKAVQPYFELTRLNRPIGIFLLLWPTYWALWIASSGAPKAELVVIFTLGTILMRSAGCAMNDFADRKIDPHVARTRLRPLARKALAPYQAILTAALLTLIAFILVLQTNQKTILLSFVAVFLAALYPFSKRFTYIPQLFLGAAFAWSIPMAFAAHNAPLSHAAWYLFIVTLIWTISYDTLYAMVDRKDDLKIGIGSTAILFGKQDRLIIGALQATVLLGLCLLGHLLALNFLYFLSLAVAMMSFIYQQWLIRERNQDKCFQAFIQNAWTGAVIFCGFFLGY